MTVLPEPTPTAPAAGQATPTAADRETVRRLFAAIDEITAEKPKVVRNDDPAVPSWKDGPRIGDTPPVQQPGRPAMSQRATDISGVMLAGSVASVPLGGMTCLVLYTLDQVDPVSLTIGASAPVALILAISALLRRAKGVLPEEHHHHYGGNVYEQHTTTNSRSVWNKTINK
jgi:hypothetical protein